MFNSILKCANDNNLDVLDRIISQVYNEGMLHDIMNIYNFKSVIYTLYQQDEWTPIGITAMCMRTGVRFITVEYHLANNLIINLLHDNGIYCAIHTVNEKDSIKGLEDVDLIYTDFLGIN